MVVNILPFICPNIASKYNTHIKNNRINGDTLTAKKANFLNDILLNKISIMTAPIRAQHTKSIIPPLTNL